MGMILTSKGFELVAKALTGKTLQFTKIRFGDAVKNNETILPTLEEQLVFEELIHERDISLPITSCKPVGGAVNLTFRVNNAYVSAGFYIKEIGIYAKVDGVECLYAYQYVEKQEWLPAAQEELWDIFMSVAVTISNAANVTAVLDKSGAYVTFSDFSDHWLSDNPHPNIPQHKDNVTTATDIWVASEFDSHLHKMTVQNLAKQILGDTTDISTLAARVNQTEANIANLFMRLKAKALLGFDANLLMIEDFQSLDCCDFFKVRVPVQVEGVDDLEIATDEGIHAGACYTLSDGVRSEAVLIKAVAKNGEKYVATLAAPLTETYDLTNTYLYRSTLEVVDGTAYGAGDLRTRYFQFTKAIWAGATASDVTIITLDTSQANRDSFDLTGDAAFTADGAFTLL